MPNGKAETEAPADAEVGSLPQENKYKGLPTSENSSDSRGREYYLVPNRHMEYYPAKNESSKRARFDVEEVDV